MPTKPLERLMFAQGGQCFFCTKAMTKDEASVEHLVPSARSGSNLDDNCVACCKSLNSLLGSMSLKEKVKVVLNQKGDFQCPNGASISALNLAIEATISSCSVDASPTPVIALAPAMVPLVVAAKSLAPAVTATPPPPPPPKRPAKKASGDLLARVIKDLKNRGKSKPLRLKTLTSTIKAMPLKLDAQQLQSVVEQLRSQGKIVVTGTKVSYEL